MAIDQNKMTNSPIFVKTLVRLKFLKLWIGSVPTELNLTGTLNTYPNDRLLRAINFFNGCPRSEKLRQEFLALVFS